MKPVIVLPIWCQHEVEQFCWMMERWDVVTNTRLQYEFLIACRFDFKGDTSRLEQLCKMYAPVKVTTLIGKYSTYPAAASEMWFRTMQLLYKQKDISFAFWLEHDVLPQNVKWFDILVDKWNKRDKHVNIMGQFLSDEWLDANGHHLRGDAWGAHINGVACYDPRVYNKAIDVRWDISQAWDIQLNLGDDTLGIDLHDMRITDEHRASAGTSRLMTHGCKTIPEKEKIYNFVLEKLMNG